MIEIDEQILAAMTRRLRKASEKFAFIQARVSAETFIRDECAIAIHEFIKPSSWEVHLEKKVSRKKVDIIIAPLKDNRIAFSKACLIELKMAWPGGLGECSGYVRKDLDALSGNLNAWSLVLFFAFEDSHSWMPFGKRKRGFEDGLCEFIDRVGGQGPSFQGNEFSFKYQGVSGRAKLLAWRAR